MKKIVISNLKGGVGKTFLTFNIGYTLALKHNKKVLMIDTDSQANLTGYAGQSKISRDSLSGVIASLLANDLESYEIIGPENIVKNVRTNLDILPSSIHLELMSRQLDSSSIGSKLFPMYMKKFKDFFNKYDVILIDTKPAMSTINDSMFLLADEVLLVSDVSEDGAEGLQQVSAWNQRLFQVEDRNFQVSGIILNNVKANTRYTHAFLKQLIDDLGTDAIDKLVLQTKISSTVKVPESRALNKALVEFVPGHKVTLEIESVVQELLEREIV